ncbi:MAG: DotA/TraY family protein [Micavibrio sp.]|nr:DotA/TraY family protein [Micavibrio sp.]
MSDSNDSTRVKRTSVGAFLFLPQFGMSLRGFSHIYPVFMRCIALMFAQSKLIPDNHPALFYGAQGIPNTRVSDLFGEAWFTLRTSRATGAQWGMFSAIILMVVTLGAALGTAMLRICFGLGDAAQAQIFAHPCDPYGGGACGTSGDTGMAAVAGITAPGALFDSRVSGSGISTDYALMVLDKVLRQAATGKPGNGGAMQNALADLMGVYNSGVLLVAGAIIFWMIMSIIVDTAKTGIFGGGRHNMVWTPIRIVFALGIMIPLGTQGFSSGQYMVMKLAEWGSNFGTQGWVTYVNGVLTDKSLLAPFAPDNASTIVTGVSKTLLCQVGYNAFLFQSTGGLNAQQVINAVTDTNDKVAQVTNRYTNATDSNICGTITYGTDANKTTEDNNLILAGTTVTTPMDATSAAAAGNAANRTKYTNTNTDLATAMQNFRNNMLGALKNVLNDTSAGAMTDGGSVIQTGRQFACNFAASYFADASVTPNPVNSSGNCTGATSAAYPDSTAQRTMQKQIMDAVANQYETSAKQDFQNYIDNSMLNEMKKRGWAGMGMWYQDVSSMNGVIQGSAAPVATVSPGTIWTGDGSADDLSCHGAKLQGRACKMSNLDEFVVGLMSEYDRWWNEASRPSATNTTNPVATSNYDLNPAIGGSIKTFVKAVAAASPGDGAILTALCNMIWPRADNIFLFKAVDLAATNTYPLAQLAEAGHSIIATGTIIIGALTVIQTVSSISGLGFSAGGGFAASALPNGIASIAMMMIVAGIMIAFYLPIVPFLRVAMAVLTWATSVFEAVVMVPIAALAHLSSEGEGLAGGARTAWILWLNVLMRPILVVFGFVGGMLIFNTFAIYFHTTFSQGAASVVASNLNPFMAIMAQVAYSIIYLGTLYTAANTSFKLLDVFPSALMRWMGGSPDHSMDDHSDGMMMAATNLLGNASPQFNLKGKGKAPGKVGAGA